MWHLIRSRGKREAIRKVTGEGKNEKWLGGKEIFKIG